MSDWLSIGNEDLTYRPRAKAGDKVYHANSNLVCTVVGLEGRLLPEWEHVQ